MPAPRRLRALIAALGVSGLGAPLPAQATPVTDPDAFAWPKAALEVACKAMAADYTPLRAEAFMRAFPDATVETGPPREPRGPFKRQDLSLRRPDGARLDLRTVTRGEVLLRLSIESWQPPAPGTPARPLALLIAGGDCRPAQGRRILYDGDGIARSLRIVGPDLARRLREEPLNPPVPPGTDADGVTVAVIDSGLAYDRPDIAARLARDRSGNLIGGDFWDMDARPYDLDSAASPFVAGRHGTLVADLLMRMADIPVRLVPLRYPRPDMSRFTALVDRAAEAGARIATLAMGSDTRSDWDAFARAAAARPDILFVVSAGNKGRDIDATPVYPAALPLDNLLVVTSVTDAGLPAPGSNWGAVSVDLGLPAEMLVARDHMGRPRSVAGSSFAVPLAAALAARLAAEHPGWDASDLKRALLARGRPIPAKSPAKAPAKSPAKSPPAPPIAHGWIDARPPPL